MKKPKAIFFDVDGTLLSHTTGKVPESAVKALNLAKRSGIKIFIATGRHKKELNEQVLPKTIEFDGFVTLNGQYCYRGGEIIRKNTICAEDIRFVAKALTENPFPCMFFEEDETYIVGPDSRVEKVFADINMAKQVISGPERILTDEIYQMCIFSEERRDFLVKNLRGCKFTSWFNQAWDITPKTGGKWDGIKQMLKYCGISAEFAAAVGDGENDIDMLINAGFSVAMGNAPGCVKQHADFVTTDVDEDGIWNAVKRLTGLG
jgi:Cof subfamily protein (haloacid dehalogenase superfamily)